MEAENEQCQGGVMKTEQQDAGGSAMQGMPREPSGPTPGTGCNRLNWCGSVSANAAYHVS